MPVSHAPRRRLLRLIGRAAMLWPLTVVAQTPPLKPTPAVTVGPFYPPDPMGLPFFRAQALDPLPKGYDLMSGRDGRRAEGEPIRIGGRILDTARRPVAGATVEIWQVDARGHYAVEVGADRDPGFAGYGVDRSDAEGRYAFVTLRPRGYARYGGLIRRAAHIHIRVAGAGRPPLASEIWFADEPGNERDSFVGRIEDPVLRERMLVRLTRGDDGLWQGVFDVVLPNA